MYANTAKPGAVGGPRKITAPDLRARKAPGARAISAADSSPTATVPSLPTSAAPTAPITMVTAYDFTMARLFDEAGVDAVLVGDSLGMVVQGLANTLPVTLDEMVYHCRAVARGLQRAHLVGDLPFMSYQASVVQALESAGKLLKEGACESVKLEGGADFAEQVYRMVRAGIPVMGHIGLTPQSVHAFGGFKLQGRGDEAAQRIFDDAKAIEEAGAYAIVLEAVPPDLGARITESLSIPTIGIGAGNQCDGQVLVYTDMLGLSRGHTPKFAKHFAKLGDAVVEATRSYIDEVQSGAFPAPEHTFKPNQVVVAHDSDVRLTG